ncbi:nitroreductase family protein [Paratractidigestivibacter sp.]|uniref:nitroreductase family protein n=1 Tax=Paratractidigestivibacter sp. TaxID=2847316 RepID=UPI002AC901AD|nr:nitroreductase family protein [Paratractidigestivibacter sp.]
MSIVDVMRDRYSERRFSPEPVEEEKLRAILEAGNLAPTAEDRQPQRILVLRGDEAMAEVDACTRCRFGAPVVLALAYDMAEAARNPDVADFGPVDVAIVGDHMALAAAELGVHSCWVGLIDPSEIRRRFSVPPTYRIVALMPLGYPSDKSRPSRLHRRRKGLEETVFFDSYAPREEAGA